ncbi:MAG: RNA-protein complex protein Nop10 [Candidatus Methanomethylophilaceae archaeon]|nr:RNA-protein complex protein Nop10 [Candidatus Methanomethylophilaceae archaeon]
MRSSLRRCRDCGAYSTKEICPDCGARTETALPPRYSPDDRYGEYRRTAIEQEYGENGKCHKLL